MNLTSVFKICRAPSRIWWARGRVGDCDHIIGRRSALVPGDGPLHRLQAPVVELMRNLARELARHRIGVNTLHPTGVRTSMVFNSYLGE